MDENLQKALNDLYRECSTGYEAKDVIFIEDQHGTHLATEDELLQMAASIREKS